MDQQQQQNNTQETEAFARVWKRVSPDPDTSPIVCGEAPSPPGGHSCPRPWHGLPKLGSPFSGPRLSGS